VYCCGACLSLSQLISGNLFIVLASLLDCDNLCYIRSSTLSVRNGLTTSHALRVHTYRSNYTKRAEQRQMYVPYHRPSCSYLICLPGVYRIRILYMPPVYAIISFFSFRFFRSYTYYSLAETGEFASSFSLVLRVSISSASVRGTWCRAVFGDVGHSSLQYTRLLP